MSQPAEYPFEGYTLYIVFHKKEGRRMAQLVNGSVHRTTMSYARYLMSVQLGRLLTEDEHVDHINDDKSDDRLENFQILTQKENREKFTKSNPATLLSFVCPICSCEFKLSKQRAWGKLNPCCSKKCGSSKTSKTLSKKYGER